MNVAYYAVIALHVICCLFLRQHELNLTFRFGVFLMSFSEGDS